MSMNSNSPPILDIPIPKAPDPSANPAAYLRSIHAVRERTRIVYDLAKKDQLKHFHVDMTKLSDTAQYVCSIIKVRVIRALFAQILFLY